MEAKLSSFKDSQVGVEYVYRIANDFGFTEGLYALAREGFATVPLPDVGDTAGDAANGGAGGSGSSLGAASSNPGGRLPPSDTHRALTLAYEAARAETNKYIVDTRRWVEFDGAVWRVCHTLLASIGDMAAALTPQLLNTQRGASRVRALESTGTLVSVRTQLQSRPAMLVHEDHFDADPRLLNTPDFVINLETGDSYPHAPGFLTRQQTLVTPAFTTIGHYETSAPRFFQLLYILADGRSWVIPFLQRWFGYCLTGKIGHQHFLFIQGLPKTGKTQLVTIMLLLMHTYATTLRSIWMMKNSEKRFDMVKVIGKRMGFVDETQKGSTFDEERLSNVAGSLRLQAEPKGGEEFDFDNRVKLILTGNHRPNFVSGEAGGLMRRLLLLKVTSKPLSEIPGIKVQKNFAEEVVKAEGPAILMWAVEGAMLDYADKDGKIFDQLKIPMEEAAKSYTRENSMYWQWIEARMRLGPLDEVDIDLLEAFEQFKGYVYEVTRERCRDRRTDFKQALKAMLRDRIEFDTRTKGPYKGRAYIRGLGHAQQFEEGGNVVSFGTALGAKNV